MSCLRMSDQGERLRGLSIGMLAGSLAGNVFCLKSWVELLQVSVAERSIANWCWEPIAWVCLSVFVRRQSGHRGAGGAIAKFQSATDIFFCAAHLQMLIFGLCCFAGWNIRILERGLQEFEALFMVAVFTASQIVAGFVVRDRVRKFCTCTLLTLMGHLDVCGIALVEWSGCACGVRAHHDATLPLALRCSDTCRDGSHRLGSR